MVGIDRNKMWEQIGTAAKFQRENKYELGEALCLSLHLLIMLTQNGPLICVMGYSEDFF